MINDTGRVFLITGVLGTLLLALNVHGQPNLDKEKLTPLGELKVLSQSDLEVSPPLVGEGFKVDFNGEVVSVDPVNTDHLSGMLIGIQQNKFVNKNEQTKPYGAYFLWENNRSKGSLLNWTSSIIYNNLFYHQELGAGFDFVFNLEQLWMPESSTVPNLNSGNSLFSLKEDWYTFEVGVGTHRQVDTGSFNLEIKNLSLRFKNYNRELNAKSESVFPVKSSYARQLALHGGYRFDILKRNLLGLPNEGWQFGGDVIIPVSTQGNLDLGTQPFVQGFAMLARSMNFWENKKHNFQLVWQFRSLDADNPVDAEDIGGGISVLGESYQSSFQPVLPGLSLNEIKASTYNIFHIGYRYQLTFFSFLRAQASMAKGNWNRVKGIFDELKPPVASELSAFSVGLITGFLLSSRLSLDYSICNLSRSNNLHAQDFTMSWIKQF